MHVSNSLDVINKTLPFERLNCCKTKWKFLKQLCRPWKARTNFHKFANNLFKRYCEKCNIFSAIQNRLSKQTYFPFTRIQRNIIWTVADVISIVRNWVYPIENIFFLSNNTIMISNIKYNYAAYYLSYNGVTMRFWPFCQYLLVWTINVVCK